LGNAQYIIIFMFVSLFKSVSSPLESFEVFELFGLHTLFGYLSLTNLGLYASLVATVVIALHLLSVNSHRIVPSR
jgi:hypothetical protein